MSFGISVSNLECKQIIEICKNVRIRAARLCAAAIYGLLLKCPEQKDITIALDGTLWRKYTKFRETLLETLRVLVGENYHRISLESAHDGSGVGAAVAASLFS